MLQKHFLLLLKLVDKTYFWEKKVKIYARYLFTNFASRRIMRTYQTYGTFEI